MVCCCYTQSLVHKLAEASFDFAHKLLEVVQEFLLGLLGAFELHFLQLVEERLGLVGKVGIHDLVGRLSSFDDGLARQFVVVNDAAHHTGGLH